MSTLSATNADFSLGTTTKSSSRSADLDGMRGIAILGVIWLHCAEVLPEGSGLFAVPFFIITAIVMTARSVSRHPEQSSANYIGKRFLRLYPAFLFWCVIYEAIRQTKAIQTGGISSVKIEWRGFIGGTYEHLWFVPFLLLATIIIVPLVKMCLHSRPLRIVVGLLALTAAIAWSAYPVPEAIENAKAPWMFIRPSWWAIPALFLGVAVSMQMMGSRFALRTTPVLGVVGAIVLITTTALQWRNTTPWLPAATYGGLGAMWLAMSGILSPVLSRLATLGTMSLGIYLSHVVFLRMLVIVCDKKNIEHTAKIDIAGFFIALIGAMVVTWVLSRSKWTRWTVGG